MANEKATGGEKGTPVPKAAYGATKSNAQSTYGKKVGEGDGKEGHVG